MKLQQCIVEIVSYMLVTKATKAWIPFFIYRFATRNHPCNVLSIWAWLPDAGCSSRILLSTRYGNLRIRAVVSILNPSVVFSETREVPKEIWTRLLKIVFDCMVDSEFELFDRMNEEWKKKYYTYLYLNQHFGHEHVSFLCLIYLPLMKYFSKIVIDVLFRNMQFSYVTNCYLAKYAILTSSASPCSQ